MKISRAALDELLAHAHAADPQECCGVLLGVGERIVVAVRGRNLAESRTQFLLDPRDHIAARRQARAAHQDVLGFYHSHPRSAPTPSSRDVAEWSYPEAMMVIVGQGAQPFEARAFRLIAGVTEEVALDLDAD